MRYISADVWTMCVSKGESMKRINLLTSFLIFMLASVWGCTGTSIVIQPEPDTITAPTTKGCGRVAIREVKEDGSTSTIPGEVVLEFAKYLEQSGLFNEVYCPVRDSDEYNVLLHARFNHTIYPKTAVNNVRSVVMGASLFLFEPFIWYEFSFEVAGKVDVKKEGTTVASFNSNARADLYYKFLSPVSGVLVKEVLPASYKASFAQLTRELETYCKNSTGEMANLSGKSNRSLRETH